MHVQLISSSALTLAKIFQEIVFLKSLYKVEEEYLQKKMQAMLTTKQAVPCIAIYCIQEKEKSILPKLVVGESPLPN